MSGVLVWWCLAAAAPGWPSELPHEAHSCLFLPAPTNHHHHIRLMSCLQQQRFTEIKDCFMIYITASKRSGTHQPHSHVFLLKLSYGKLQVIMQELAHVCRASLNTLHWEVMALYT